VTPLLLLLLACVAWAVPVEVPPGQGAAWSGPVSLHGWEVGPVGDGPYVRIVDEGERIRLEVRGEDGVLRVRRLDRPTTEASREDVLALARSLLREGRRPDLPSSGGALSLLPTPTPPAEARSTPERTAPARPTPPPVPATAPAEVAAVGEGTPPTGRDAPPDLAPAVEIPRVGRSSHGVTRVSSALARTATQGLPDLTPDSYLGLGAYQVGRDEAFRPAEREPPSWRGWVGVVGGVEARPQGEVSVGVGPAARGGLVGGLGVGRLELGLELAMSSPGTLVLTKDRHLRTTDVSAELAVRPWRLGPRFGADVSASRRLYDREGVPVARHTQGSMGGFVGVVVPLATHFELRGHARLRQDLGWTTLQAGSQVRVLQRSRLVADLAIVSIIGKPLESR